MAKAVRAKQVKAPVVPPKVVAPNRCYPVEIPREPLPKQIDKHCKAPIKVKPKFVKCVYEKPIPCAVYPGDQEGKPKKPLNGCNICNNVCDVKQLDFIKS